MTQSELAELVDKKREYISRVENNGSNLTLKTLFDIRNLIHQTENADDVKGASCISVLMAGSP